MIKKRNKRILNWAFIFWLILMGIPVAQAKEVTDEAEQMFGRHQNSLYQIQMIDLASGKKSSIGSGFQFTAEGHIATNYHVVAPAITEPERFRIESIWHDGSVDPIQVLNIDVVHDLAVIKGTRPADHYLVLGSSELSKGMRLLSMGNPYDLGMAIVEGLYNGLMEHSLYRKILFTGSINSGMSGGPTVNHEGEVVGINVATAGNQVSFLVPVEHLRDLFKEITEEQIGPETDWTEKIKQELTAHQEYYISTLLDSNWAGIPIGDAIAPGEVSDIFKCWGESRDEESELHQYAYVNCSSEDELFLSPTLATGKITYHYMWVASKGLNPIRFYNLYTWYFSNIEPYDNAGKEDVTNFECHTQFVDVAQEDFKVAMCTRRYKKFPTLYDINLSLASVNKNDRGLLGELMILGVTENKVLALAKKFLEEIKWPK